MLNDPLGLTDEIAISVGRGSALEDPLSIRGHVLVEVFNKDGELKDFRETENLITTAGKNHVADALSSSPSEAAMSHMAVGTGTTAPAAGDTALQTQLDRNALTSRTEAGAVVTYVGDWAAGDATNGAISEAGIFNNAAGGTMLARATFTAIPKGAGDTLKITWTVTVG